MKYFNYLSGLTMTNRRFAELFGGPPREAGVGDHPARARPRGVDPGRHRGRRAHAWRAPPPSRPASATRAWPAASRSTASPTACCCARARSSGIWIQPAAGDAGGAVGAALYGWHQILDNPREADGVHDQMQGAYLGPRVRRRRGRGVARRARLPLRASDRRSARRAHRGGDRRRRRRRARSRGAWSSGRARSVTARSSATRVHRRCSRS